MSRRVCSNCSGRATAGSYSISACSWVKLTATLSTPGRLPSAFSIVPVHNEQCSPPMCARIRRRPGSFEGSSLQKPRAVSTVVAVLIILALFLFALAHATPCSQVQGQGGKMDGRTPLLSTHALCLVNHAPIQRSRLRKNCVLDFKAAP